MLQKHEKPITPITADPITLLIVQDTARHIAPASANTGHTFSVKLYSAQITIG